MTDTIVGTVTIEGVVYEFTAELSPVEGGHVFQPAIARAQIMEQIG